jgi:predicted metalloprotease with PDZ domain
MTADDKVTEGYRTYLGLMSHEYFHAWNVKQIRPKELLPLTYEHENYTKLLWFFEGFTSYYDDLFLVRSGLISPTSYLELLAKTITKVMRGAGRLNQSVAESSFDAWIKFYRPDENTPNAVVSYYTKGSLVALALDLQIRAHTKNERSLDDVMRAVWKQHGQTKSGLAEENVLQVVQEVTGTSFASFFETALHKSEDLPLAELFRPLGIDLLNRPAENEKDEGGTPPRHKDAQARKPYFGAKWKNDAQGSICLTHVPTGSPAEKAGLCANDVIVAADHWRTTPSNFMSLLASFPTGTLVDLHFFRRHALKKTSITLEDAPHDTYYFSVLGEVDKPTQSARQAWLGS